jgi:hypothetical protein
MNVMPLECTLKSYSPAGWGRTPLVEVGCAEGSVWCAAWWPGCSGSTAGRKPPCGASPLDGAEPPRRGRAANSEGESILGRNPNRRSFPFGAEPTLS